MARTAVEAILRYLDAHPDANDTAEGVMRWWLLDEETSWPLTEIQRSLGELVQLGFVTQTRRGDGQVRYARAPGKYSAIRSFLATERE